MGVMAGKNVCDHRPPRLGLRKGLLTCRAEHFVMAHQPPAIA
ncbi:hypothetical protein [Cereibacter ovatus]|nr:hypothetical protein [Cereibacter ovatus]